MKYSEAMLKGFEMVGGKQHIGSYADNVDLPTALCVVGAINLARYGYPRPSDIGLVADTGNFSAAFYKTWGVHPSELNDEGMPWEHLYGMAVAAGL